MSATWFTVAQVAERLQVTKDEIWHQIRAGNIGHMVLNPRAKRPTYRISDRHLLAFERQRERSAA